MSPTTKAKPKAAPKAAAAKEVPAYAKPDIDAVADRIHAELSDLGDLSLGGDINAPNQVAYNARNLFEKYRYNDHFRLILELAYKDGHAYGRGDS